MSNLNTLRRQRDDLLEALEELTAWCDAPAVSLSEPDPNYYWKLMDKVKTLIAQVKAD